MLQHQKAESLAATGMQSEKKIQTFFVAVILCLKNELRV